MKRFTVRALTLGAVVAGTVAVLGAPAQAATWTSGPNAGIGNGNQTSIVIQAPTNVCGNAVAVFGFARARCAGGATATNK